MNVTFASLVAAMTGIARSTAVSLAAAWAVLTVAGALADTTVADGGVASLATLGVSILQLVLTVAVMRRALDAMGIERTGGAGVGGLFLLSIPVNLGIALGFVLLVLPGLYLAARWRIAVPHLLASGDGFDSIGHSWDRTRPHWRALMGASLLPVIPFTAAVLLLALSEEGAVPLSTSILFNGLLYAGIAIGWLLDLTAYRLIDHSAADLAETFA